MPKKATLPRSKYTAFRCPVDLLDAARAEAKSQRRSLSNYVITLIEEAAIKSGRYRRP